MEDGIQKGIELLVRFNFYLDGRAAQTTRRDSYSGD